MSSRQSKAVRSSLLTKEEQIRQLNAELTAKTESLWQEADAVLRGQEQVLTKSTKPSLLNNVDENDLFEWTEDGDIELPTERAVPSTNRPPKSQPSARSTTGRSRGKTNPSVSKGNGPRSTAHASLEDIGGDFQKASLHRETSADGPTSTRLSDDAGFVYNDVLPPEASEMNPEHQIRMLKAKVRVTQEEMDRIMSTLAAEDKALSEAQNKLKEFEDEKGRLQRTNAAQHTQLDKLKKLSEEKTSLADSLTTQVSTLKKELDTLTRNQKQQSTNQGAVEVRLNQAREEIQKYKDLLQKAQAEAKENLDQEKLKVEQLTTGNKRLEKQKTEVLNGFKKQMKLIDVLKRQKMHLEAARMLNFTEEEFIEALEMGNS